MHVLSEREEMGGYLRALGQQVKSVLFCPLSLPVTPRLSLFLHKEKV